MHFLPSFELEVTSFHLEFLSFWVSRLLDLGNLGVYRMGPGIFSKITFLKSVHSKEKDEACISFLVNIFTKSVHRKGVIEKKL